jgi:DNA-binding CsgD family transcriptional regulator
MDANASDHGLIGALSVLGDRFDLQLAVEISGMPAGDALHALETAQRDGLVAVDNGSVEIRPERREQAYHDLGPHGQAMAHAHAAEVLARVRPRDLDTIAEQRAGATAVLGLEPALRAFDQAATAAERALEWEHAARLWGQAAGLASREHHVQVGNLTIRKSRCLFRAGLFGEAMAVCRRLASDARAAGDWRLLADASLVVRGIGDRDTCAVLLDLCRDALPGVGDDIVLRSRLRSQVIMLSCELAQVTHDSAEAKTNVEAADASGDALALAEALHALQMVCAGPLNTARRLEIADRVERLAIEDGLVDYAPWPLRWRMDACFQLGQRPALDNAVTRLEEYADQRNDALAAWSAKMARAMLAQHEGRFEEAIQFADEALDLAARGDHHGGDFAYRILVSQCRVKMNGGPVDDALLGISAGPDAFHAYVAMEWANLGDFESATAHFDLALPAMGEIDGTDLQVPTYAALATVAWILSRADAAPAIYAALEPFAEELANSASGQAVSLGSVSRYLGQMAGLMGDWDRVEMDFGRAVRRNLETGARAEVAETRFDWAMALLRRGLPRDRERAGALLGAAEQAAAELGMQPLRRQAVDAVAALKSRRSPLTARELEVAALVAEGLTNREVAARLRISVRTAENHLLNVMNKLGCNNRAQVAGWFARTQSTNESLRS